MAPAQKQKGEAAQKFVPVQEVRDGFVILKDGSVRAVLMASSTNFALKSADEQQAILAQFQNALNTLDFSVQIAIQSRKLDIRPYLNLLEEQYEKQTSDLMRVQTREYIDFIKSFTESANIMSKNFFVVVPYAQSGFGEGTRNFVDSIKSMVGLGGGGGAEKEDDTNAAFEQKRAQLEQRISVVQQGLNRAGVKTVRLGTEEVIEMYYKIFNPGDQEKPIPLEERIQERDAVRMSE